MTKVAKNRCPIIRNLYHNTRWLWFSIITAGNAGKTYQIKQADVRFGQLPFSQFPRRGQRFVEGGNWDNEVVAIEDHSVYRSMAEHFLSSTPWPETAHYQEALDDLEAGQTFRGVNSIEMVDQYFGKWDQLYESIRQNGFRSNRQLYQDRLIDNPCHRLDEVTVNLSRDGSPILNDGWHRFCIARILNLPAIPVRILARHKEYPHWIPAGDQR